MAAKANPQPVPETIPSCTRCGKEDAAPGLPKWCKTCRAEYQRNYQGTVKTMAKKQGFHEGVKAMRDTIVEEFDRLRIGNFTGEEIAKLVQQMPGPKPEPED